MIILGGCNKLVEFLFREFYFRCKEILVNFLYISTIMTSVSEYIVSRQFPAMNFNKNYSRRVCWWIVKYVQDPLADSIKNILCLQIDFINTRVVVFAPKNISFSKTSTLMHYIHIYEDNTDKIFCCGMIWRLKCKSWLFALKNKE